MTDPAAVVVMVIIICSNSMLLCWMWAKNPNKKHINSSAGPHYHCCRVWMMRSAHDSFCVKTFSAIADFRRRIISLGGVSLWVWACTNCTMYYCCVANWFRWVTWHLAVFVVWLVRCSNMFHQQTCCVALCSVENTERPRVHKKFQIRGISSDTNCPPV